MFTKTTVNNLAGDPSERIIMTETVTLANAGTASSSAFEVPKGSNWVVFANTGAVNTVGAVTTDLQGSFDGTTWVDIDASFLADLDTATLMKAYVADTSGDFPFYRFQFDCAANDSATTIDVVVVEG